MATGYVCIVIGDSTLNIGQLNSLVVDHGSTKVHEELQSLINYLIRLNSGESNGIIQVTSRDTDPSIATSGTGSKQVSYSKL